MGAVTVAGTTVSGLIGAIRIRKIEAWSASMITGGAALTSFGAMSGVGIEWLSTQSQSKITEDYGDLNRPAHYSSRPPRTCLASDWFSTTGTLATNIFRLFGAAIGVTGMNPASAMPFGTIIDLSVVMTLLNPTDSVPIPFATVSAAPLGSVLFRGLDGLALAASGYNVVGYPQS